jgi:predicted nucleic acid-binding protein
MPPRLHLDANVILRFLRNDHPTHSPAAQRLFAEAKAGTVRLVLSEVTTAEIFYVLTSCYKHARADAAARLLPLIQSDALEIDCRNRVVDTLLRVEKANVDFGDAYLASCASEKGDSVASFDKDLQAFTDVTTVVPQ